jgi:general secretion pathway protein A
LSKNHREAFAHLLYGINNRAGFIALTGEVGSGRPPFSRLAQPARPGTSPHGPDL